MPATAPREEERKARERLKRLEKARKAAAAKAAKEAQSRRAQVIREEKSRSRARDCSCPITTRTTLAQLLDMGSGCTSGMYVCPTLDAIRRRLGH